MDKDNPSKKPTRKKTKPTSTPIPTPAILNDPSLLSAEENKQFLDQINSFLKKKDNSHKESLNDYKVLQLNIGEFLESFITFGYTFSGQRVLIQNYPSPRDKDALLEFLKNVFVLNSSSDTPYLDNE